MLLGLYLDLVGFYWVLLCFTGFNRDELVLRRFYWVLLGFTGLYRVVLGFTGFLQRLDWIVNGFYWVLLWCYLFESSFFLVGARAVHQTEMWRSESIGKFSLLFRFRVSGRWRCLPWAAVVAAM